MKQNNNNKLYTIYKHTNKANGKTYIGVTSQKPERRWRGGKGYMGNELFFDDILKFGFDNGFTHEILAKTTRKEVADILESEFIKAYQTLGLSYNIREGGYEGFKLADSTRQKISEALSGENNYWYGKHHSAETRQKMSEAKSGEKAPNYGKFGADNPCSKEVAQIDRKDGHIIKIWDGTMEAQRETGIAQQNISAACRGKLNSAGGYGWRYM